MVHGISAVSRVDSKGRVSIPIGLRAKLRLVEGSNVRIVLEKNRLIVSPNSDANGQSSVKVSTRVCGALRPGSSLGSDPNKRGELR